MRSLAASMRTAVLAACAALITGCGGSSLSACPDHQPCVHFVGAPAVGGNGASDDGGAVESGDMARASAADLATKAADQSVPAGDLAATSSDLLPACLPTGGNCAGHNDAICCSHYCVYATNTCR